jgi:hypothetical protein
MTAARAYRKACARMDRDYRREAVVAALWTLLEEGLLARSSGHYDEFWSYLRAYDEKNECKDQLQLDLGLDKWGHPSRDLVNVEE